MQEHYLAAIDIGTNSFHLIIVKVLNNGTFEIIDREKEVIRLSEGFKGDIKYISETAMERAIDCLNKFKGIAESYDARIRAVATSAVRESLNRNEFKHNVLSNTGIDVEIISGYEEARLIYLGSLKAVPIYETDVLGIDIGGGSTEFYVGYKGSLKFANSMKLGAVRLTQRFFPDNKITKSKIEKCEKWVEGELFPLIRDVKNVGFTVSIGSSGTIQAAANMILSKQKSTKGITNILNNFTFSFEELKEITKEVLSKKTTKERERINGLDKKRADIIPAGLIILNTIFEQLNITEMRVSGYSLREGIVIDALQKTDLVISPKLHGIRIESVKQLSKSCNFDSRHCDYVAKLAISLFDELKDLHKLSSVEREYLEVAAMLHDIGYHISHSQHHRHSLYIIKNSELLGFNENEIKIIANVARYHRKSHPKDKHSDFTALNLKSQEIVNKLGAILRVADALDRTHQQNITIEAIELSSDKVIINISSRDGEPDIELWSLDRRKGLFEEIFQKEVCVKLN